MCGLAGFYSLSSRRNSADMYNSLRRMTACLAHTGAGESRYWLDRDAGIALGYRQQTPASTLFPSPSGRYYLTLAGNIDNHQALRNRLSHTHQHHWQSPLATETLQVAIEYWGLQRTLQACIGRFAMSVWDSHTRRLTLVRDRLGEMNLYYGWAGQTLLFASELKALRTHPEWNTSINRTALACQLRLGHIPAPLTIYQQAFKLEPGHCLHMTPHNLPGTPLHQEAWWSLPKQIEHARTLHSFQSIPEATARLEQTLDQAISQQMQARHLPTGTFLYGDAASALLAAMMRPHAHQPVKTFTLHSTSTRSDTRRQTRLIAHHLGTEHHEFTLSPAHALDLIPQLPALFEEPCADTSQIPALLLAQAARKRVRLCLSNQGANELFAGHHRYRQTQRLWQNLQHLPEFLRNRLARTLLQEDAHHWEKWLFSPLLPQYLRSRTPGENLHNAADTLHAHSPVEVYFHLMSHWKQPEEVMLGLQKAPTPFFPHIPAGMNCVEQMMYMDTLIRLPGTLLTGSERIALTTGLKIRSPFLTESLVTFAWQLPLHFKLHNGQNQWMLRRILDKHLPLPWIRQTAGNAAIPLGEWLRHPLREWVEHLLQPARLRQEGLFDPAPIWEKWQQHLAGTHNWQHHLWNVLMFQAWHEQQTPLAHALAA